MGYYPEVKPGDKVKHYAQKENDLNAILSQHSRQGLTPSAGRAKRVMSNQCVVTVMNNTTSALKAMSAVSVDEAAMPVGDTEDEIIVPVKQTTDTNKPFFILETTLETKGEIGTALVSGVTAAKVNISNLAHMYAVPDTSAGNVGKLISASNGTAQIIWKSSATATGEILVLLRLGGGSGASNEYSGYFAVVKASDTTVAVVDGAALVSSICGYYEHGIQRRVEVTKPSAITVTATGFIYVTITYTTEYVFTFAFGTILPDSGNGSIVRKLADVTFADSKITVITQAQQGILITPGVF